VKLKLWGGKFWTSGYYVNTVGQYGNLAMIEKYVQNQGKKYKQIYRNQLSLF
jgi:REP element-mobilizing transposase RayT